MTAALFSATGLHSEALAQGAGDINSDTSTDLGLTRVDSGLLMYGEDGGRVKVIEPVINITINHESGDILTARFTSDTLTGATPNGAAPWKGSQTFTTPAHAPGTQTTVTGASGGSSIVTLPGVGTVVRQYTTAAGLLPVDPGFNDQRFAFDLGYSTLFTPSTRGSLGGSFSTEHDFRSFSINTGVSQDLFEKNTTVSVALNSEFDQSMPYFGTPTPFTPMTGVQKGGNQGKTVLDLVVGGTQVMNRFWLAQLNYSYGSGQGYQTDPYRIISVIDPQSGAPLSYLYENRPRTRVRQSLYFGNKIALGSTVTDVSVRVYHDSWGISSTTVEASERIPILPGIYVEPHARYYNQSAASFYRPYLLNGGALPAYASSDSRLGRFDGTTFRAESRVQGRRERRTLYARRTLPGNRTVPRCRRTCRPGGPEFCSRASAPIASLSDTPSPSSEELGTMTAPGPSRPPEGTVAPKAAPLEGGGFVHTFFAMGSPCEARIDCSSAELANVLAGVAEKEARRIERKFSRYRADSVISEINQSGGAEVLVDAETAALLDFATRFHDISGGLFDITSGVLRRVWTFDGSDRVPTPDAVAALMPLIGWSKVEWTGSRLSLPEGMEIDLGGLGKEYAVDCALLRVRAISPSTPVLINFGGDLRVSGLRCGGGRWRAAIESVDGPGRCEGLLDIAEGALTTSGDARRYLLKDGVRYSHILDPRTGWPVKNPPRSVTVAAPTCIEAGLLSTLAMLHGQGAQAFLADEGIQAWWVS